MTEIPRWLVANVYILRLKPDNCGYDQCRYFSAEDLVCLFNQIGPDDIVEYREFNLEGVRITLPKRIKFRVHDRDYNWESFMFDYFDRIEHDYSGDFEGFWVDEHPKLGFHPNGVHFNYNGGYN